MPAVFTSRLRAHVREKLINRPHPVKLQQIADATQLKKTWLLDLIADKHHEGSCAKFEALYRYFEGKDVQL